MSEVGNMLIQRRRHSLLSQEVQELRYQAGDLRGFAIQAFDAYRLGLQRRECAPKVPKAGDTGTIPPGSDQHQTPECFFQLGGTTRFTFAGGEQLALGSGEMLVMPRFTSHAEVHVQEDSMFRMMVVCFYPGNVFDCHLARLVDGKLNLVQAISVASDRTPRLCEYLDELSHFGQRHGERSGEIIKYLSMAFLHALADFMEDMPLDSEDRLVRSCKWHIYNSISDPELSVAGLAERMQCTPDHISRLFRQHEGQSLHAWIAALRIQRSKELLQRTDKSIADIGQLIGLNDPSYFTRRFRQLVGVTPTVYRRQCRSMRAAEKAPSSELALSGQL